MLLPDIHMTPNVARRVEAKVTKRPVRTRSAAQFGGDPVNPAEEKERCCSYDGVEVSGLEPPTSTLRIFARSTELACVSSLAHIADYRRA